MALSNFLAELWGISIVAICLSLLIKEKNVKKILATVQEEATMFYWGMIAFVIGAAMVLSHNVWVKDWQVIVTIFGWISLAKGLSLMFLPDFTKDLAKKMESATFIPIALVVAVFIGLAMTYLGFTA